MGRGLKLQIKEEEGLYYLCSEKKGADQLRSYREADLGLCFSICKKLELMFMKHYAPNRCLYIKVAKLRTGVGSAEMSYLQNCSVKLFKEHFKVQICKGRLFEKNNNFFFLFSTINFLIIFYQLTKFEAPSCYSFRDIINTNFQSPNLQREIIRKKYNNFSFNFHQLIYSSSSISWLSLKLLAVILYEIS